MDSLPGSIFGCKHRHTNIPQLRESRGVQILLDDVGLHARERADPVRRTSFELLRRD
jgi:hypothetical protein